MAGTADAVIMVEGGGSEISEAKMLEAIDFAHAEIKKMVAVQNELRAKIGKEKRTVPPGGREYRSEAEVEQLIAGQMPEAISIPDKMRRQLALNVILENAVKVLNTPENAERFFGKPDRDLKRDIANAFDDYEQELVRTMILKDGVRADGRKSDEIRPITCYTKLLPRVHGSALFVRGETQALVATTLGTADDEQKIDALEGESYKNFMLHYNFPPFSVGEVKPLRSPGRREIGHGALAERSIKYVMPTKDEFRTRSALCRISSSPTVRPPWRPSAAQPCRS